MNPLSMVRANAPAASAVAGDSAPAPGFAALLEAAREPAPAVEPDAPAQSDVPEAPTPERPEAGAAAKPPRRPPAPKVQPHAERSATPIALDVSALLQAKTLPAPSVDAAPTVTADKAPALPAADNVVAPMPPALPALPAVVADAAADTTAEAALGTRAAAVPPRAAREATAAEPLPQSSPDAAACAPIPNVTPPRGVPAAEASPGGAAKADTPRHTPTPSATETAPGAITLTAAQAPAPSVASAPSAAAPFAAQLAAALESPAFAPALATQVRWLVEGGVQHAQLTLNPAEMGPVAVRIAVDGTQARIDFMADLAPTRAALEASLPTLAAALADGGLTLAGGGVFDGSSARQPSPEGRGQPRGGQTAANAAFADAAPHAATPAPAARGLVDLVA